MGKLIYKIIGADVWRAAERCGRFDGAGVDLADGYIHFSSGTQAADTARLHFAGQTNLMLIAVDAAALGPALKWEASRGGALFPHLYGPLDLRHVVRSDPLPWDGARHIFPPSFESADA